MPKIKPSELLANLIRVLEAAPDEHFNMSRWSCGTQSCAIGWAAKDQWFQDLGLRLETYQGCVNTHYPVLDGFEEAKACRHLFGLPPVGRFREEGYLHQFLFLPSGYKSIIKTTKSEVIERFETVRQVILGETSFNTIQQMYEMKVHDRSEFDFDILQTDIDYLRGKENAED